MGYANPVSRAITVDSGSAGTKLGNQTHSWYAIYQKKVMILWGGGGGESSTRKQYSRIAAI